MVASAKRPMIRSISRVPRCQERNRSRRRRSSSPSLDRVVPVTAASKRRKPGRAGRGRYRREHAGCQRRGHSFRHGRACPGHPRLSVCVHQPRRGCAERIRMRPSLLTSLFASVTTLPGVGPKVAKLLARVTGQEDGARVADLVFHLPTGSIDRRARPKLRDVEPGTVVTVAVTIDRHRAPPPGRSRAPFSVYASDDTGDLVLTYFGAHTDYVAKLLPVGAQRYVSGTTALYDGMLQMVHPDRVVDEAGLARLPLIEPVYPLTEGLFPNQLHKAIDAAVDRLPALPEWQDPAYLDREKFPAFAEALRHVHRPEAPDDVLPSSPAWARLAYDQLLAGQLALALMRAHMRRVSGRRTVGAGKPRDK